MNRRKEEYMRGYSDGFKDCREMQPPAGETIRATQDGSMEDASKTVQSAVDASSTIVTEGHEAMEAAFDRWWKASKYRQVIFANDGERQIALDAWCAAQCTVLAAA